MTTQSAQKMGLWMATVVGLNAIIGAGIFMVPAQLGRTVGPAAILTYLFVIAAIWCIAYSLSVVARHHPAAGSFFSYAQLWGGQRAGTIAATFYCGGLVVALGLLTRMVGLYLHDQFASVPASWLSGGVLLLIMVTLLVGKRIAAWGQIVLLVLTLLPLLMITVLCLSRASLNNLSPFMPMGWGSVFNAAKVVIFGFFGFEAITALHAHVISPDRTIPRAITLAISLVSLLYLVFVTSIILAFNRELFLTGAQLPDLLYRAFPSSPWLISLVVWGVIITIMGTLHSMIWSVSMLLQSLAGLFGKHLSMNNAIVLLCAAVWLCSVMLANLELFFNITAVGIITALVMSIVPVAFRIIPVTRGEQVISWIGLLSAGVMYFYALAGIINYIIH